MTDQRIIYPNDGDGIAIMTPTPDYLQAHTIQECAAKDVPFGLPYEIIESNTLPPEIKFSAAWVANFENYQGVSVDMGKAKVVYKETADTQAAYLSTPLTQEYMRLLAIGGDTTAVQAELVSINAAAEETAYLDATTTEELIACWPPELGPNPFLPVANEIVS